MSIEKILSNIQENITGRKGEEEIMNALELLTRMPISFKKMVDAGKFFATHHSIYAGCPNGVVGGCDECYSGDTEYEYNDRMATAAVKIFKNLKIFEDDDSDGEDEDQEDDEIMIVEQLPLKRPTGFLAPVRLNGNILQFIIEGDFGFDTHNLTATKEGVTNRVMLTTLFTVYTHHNNMLKGGILTATPLMKKCFDKVFKDRNINPDSFRYNNIQSLISPNVCSIPDNENITELTLNRIETDMDMVKGVLNDMKQKKQKKKSRN